MKPSRSRVVSSTLFALFAALVSVPERASAQQYLAVLLPKPPGFLYSYALGASGGRMAGIGNTVDTANDGEFRALFWSDPSTVRDITPAGYHGAQVVDIWGTLLGGSVNVDPYNYIPLAYLWQNNGAAGVLLHPSGYDDSEVLGVGGGQQAGYVFLGTDCVMCGTDFYEHAAVWSGSAASFALLHAPGFYLTMAENTDGTRQAGWGILDHPLGTDEIYHALLWSGPSETVVDLHPGEEWYGSQAFCIGDGEQGGSAWGPQTEYYPHAMLWRGTAASAVDLHPGDKWATSWVEAVRGGVQVGAGAPWEECGVRALAWKGSAASFINLHALLPAEYQTGESMALGIDESGNIVGFATNIDAGDTVAVLWKRIDAQAPTALVLPAASGSAGQTVTLRATLKDSAKGTAIPGRTVTFKVSGSSVGTATTNTYGVATRSYTIPPAATSGSKSLAATFAGDSACKACSVSSTLSVTTATTLSVANVTAKPGQQVLLSAVLKRKSDGKVIAGKTLTFKVNGVSIGTAATNTYGMASKAYSIGSSAAGGTRTITVSFAGDTVWSAYSASGTLTIVK